MSIDINKFNGSNETKEYKKAINLVEQIEQSNVNLA